MLFQKGGEVCLEEEDPQFIGASALTSNTGELSALLHGLQWAVENATTSVRIVSDSQYAIEEVKEHWEMKANKDLIRRAIRVKKALEAKVPLHMDWTRSHLEDDTADSFWNNKVDLLAKAGACGKLEIGQLASAARNLGCTSTRDVDTTADYAMEYMTEGNRGKEMKEGEGYLDTIRRQTGLKRKRAAWETEDYVIWETSGDNESAGDRVGSALGLNFDGEHRGSILMGGDSGLKFDGGERGVWVFGGVTSMHLEENMRHSVEVANIHGDRGSTGMQGVSGSVCGMNFEGLQGRKHMDGAMERTGGSCESTHMNGRSRRMHEDGHMDVETCDEENDREKDTSETRTVEERGHSARVIEMWREGVG